MTIGPFAVLGFLLELAALVALGYAGFSQFALPLSVIAGLGLPLIAMVLWGVLRAPRRPVDSPFWLRIAVEVLVMGGAVAALAFSGLPVLAAVFAGLAVVSGIVNGREELRREA